MAKGWKYIIARAADMEPLGELRHAHERTLEVDLNKSGSAGFWTPSNDPKARQIWPYSTALIAQYDDEWYWSGLINSRSTSLGARRATVNAVSWFDRLMHLSLQDRLTQYSNEDAGTIVEDLLAKAAAQDPSLPITIGTVESTQLRTISYGLDQNIGQAILDLCNLEAGYDWYIDPITRELNIVARKGIRRENCRWTFIGDGKSKESNLSDLVEDVGPDPPTNQIRPRGKFGSGYADDDVSIAQYGIYQDAPSLSDVVDQNILDAFANAEIVYRSQPRTTYTLTPKPSTKATVPRLFREFDIGDTGFLTARQDYVNIDNQALRHFGCSLSISDVGTETLTRLQITEG